MLGASPADGHVHGVGGDDGKGRHSRPGAGLLQGLLCELVRHLPFGVLAGLRQDQIIGRAL